MLPDPRGPSRTLLVTVSAALLTLIASPRAAVAELIVNGDFEQGNVAFSSGYQLSAASILDVGFYSVTTDPRLVHRDAASYGDHTTGTGLMMAVNAATVPNVVVWSQTVAVDPGTSYDFSFWASSWFALSPAQLEVLFNGTSVGVFTAPLNTSIWQLFGATWNSGTNTTATIQIIDRNTNFSGNDFALDDISLSVSGSGTPVPEPAALSLLCLGGAVVLWYARSHPRKRLPLRAVA